MNYIEEIKAYEPADEQEASEKKVILEYIERFPETILTRENKFAHLTSSGFVMNKELTKALMIHHNIYQTWAWTGGHADGEDDLLYVAIKEAQEETGIKHVEPLMAGIASLDILPVWGHMKKGAFIATHMHLNASYILIADEEEALVLNEDETSGVRWLPIDELETYCNEPEIVKIYHKLVKRGREKQHLAEKSL